MIALILAKGLLTRLCSSMCWALYGSFNNDCYMLLTLMKALTSNFLLMYHPSKKSDSKSVKHLEGESESQYWEAWWLSGLT